VPVLSSTAVSVLDERSGPLLYARRRRQTRAPRSAAPARHLLPPNRCLLRLSPPSPRYRRPSPQAHHVPLHEVHLRIHSTSLIAKSRADALLSRLADRASTGACRRARHLQAVPRPRVRAASSQVHLADLELPTFPTLALGMSSPTSRRRRTRTRTSRSRARPGTPTSSRPAACVPPSSTSLARRFASSVVPYSS
jgi:hypothetical protein